MLPKDTKLLRLVSARNDMGASLDAYGILQAVRDPSHPMFYHAAVSMAVCYGRPFLESYGVGQLRVDYPAFPDFADPEMNLRHQRLIDLRNRFLAHSSCEGTKVLVLPPACKHPITGDIVDRHDHLVGKRTFGDIRFYDWLKDVIWALKGRLDVDVRRRLVEVAGLISVPTEMETGYEAFEWSLPSPPTPNA